MACSINCAIAAPLIKNLAHGLSGTSPFQMTLAPIEILSNFSKPLSGGNCLCDQQQENEIYYFFFNLCT